MRSARCRVDSLSRPAAVTGTRSAAGSVSWAAGTAVVSRRATEGKAEAVQPSR